MTTTGMMRASMAMASGTIVSRLLGFVKAMVLAVAIGVTASVSADAFALGNLLPNMVYAVLIGGVLNAVLVPQIVKATKDADAGAEFINKLVTFGSVALLGITALAMIATPLLVWIYATTWSPEQLALATAFAYWCLPQIFFYGLYTLLGEVLNAHSVFAPSAWSPVLNNIIAIIGLVVFIVLFGSDPNGQRSIIEWNPSMIAVLAGTATLGVAAQALILYVSWRKTGLRYRPNFQWRDLAMFRVGKVASWSLAMVVVMQLSGVVTNNIAALASGVGVSIAALQYAWLVFMVPHSVLAVSVGTAYFTRFSSSAASRDITALRGDFSSAVRVISAVMVFSAALIFVSAPYISRIILLGADSTEVLEMAALLMIYMSCLPAYSFLFVVLRGFFSLEDARTPFFITLVLAALVTFGSLGTLLLPPVLIGFGLAAVFSVATVVQTFIGTLALRKRLGSIDGRAVALAVTRFVIAALVAGGATLVLFSTLQAPGFEATVAQSLLMFVASSAVMALFYALVLKLLRAPELTMLADQLLGMRRGGRR